jgi:hypothetical protein
MISDGEKNQMAFTAYVRIAYVVSLPNMAGNRPKALSHTKNPQKAPIRRSRGSSPTEM